jgi:hypothetical protein
LEFFGNYGNFVRKLRLFGSFTPNFHREVSLTPVAHFEPIALPADFKMIRSKARSACALGNPGRLASLIVRDDLPTRGRSTISRVRKESAARAGKSVAP